MDYITHPLWETWSELVYPDCGDILAHFETNRAWFSARAQQQQQQQLNHAARLSKDVVQEESDEDTVEDGDKRTNVELR